MRPFESSMRGGCGQGRFHSGYARRFPSRGLVWLGANGSKNGGLKMKSKFGSGCAADPIAAQARQSDREATRHSRSGRRIGGAAFIASALTALMGALPAQAQ